jgi:hypothetical protein
LEVAHLTAVDLQVGSGFEWTSSVGAYVCDEVVNFHSLREGGKTLLDEGLILDVELNVLVAVHFKVPVLHLGAIVLECRETCHNLEFHLLGWLLSHYIVGDCKEARSTVLQKCGRLGMNPDPLVVEQVMKDLPDFDHGYHTWMQRGKGHFLFLVGS